MKWKDFNQYILLNLFFLFTQVRGDIYQRVTPFSAVLFRFLSVIKYLVREDVYKKSRLVSYVVMASNTRFSDYFSFSIKNFWFVYAESVEVSGSGAVFIIWLWNITDGWRFAIPLVPLCWIWNKSRKTDERWKMVNMTILHTVTSFQSLRK